MKVLHGQQLVEELRKLSESVSKRLWIAVPYIGNPSSIRRILGRTWFNNPSVKVKLLTDVSDPTGIDTETLQYFHERGQVKTLTGLHAKIYIIDDTCLVTSANLTNTAFSKRYEIGILCNTNQAKQIIKIFNLWWNKSENFKQEQVNKIFSTRRNSKEETRVSLSTIFDLPNDPDSFVKNLAKTFLNSDRLVSDYKDFAKKYESIQRIWPGQPLYFEIDGFLDYLYHHDTAPSKNCDTIRPQNLTEKKQIKEIRKWAFKFKEWAETQGNNEWRLDYSKNIKKKLSPRKIFTLSKDEIHGLLLKTNAGSSRPGNPQKIVNENEISAVRNALNILVNAHEIALPERFNQCNIIHGIGPSIMNELLGFCYPEKYPLINKDSNCGLRFFGYQIKAYN